MQARSPLDASRLTDTEGVLINKLEVYMKRKVLRSNRGFRRSARRVHRKNRPSMVMRGGIRM